MQKAHDFTATANLQSRGATANAEAGRSLNVSQRSVINASKVLARADDEINRAVESGTVSVSDAAAVATLSPEKQRQAIERVKLGPVAHAASSGPPPWRSRAGLRRRSHAR